MIAAVFALFAFVAAIGVAVVLFCLFIAKLVFGLVLLPLRLAAAGVKLVGAIVLVALVIPVAAIGAPLLALAAVFLAIVAPVALVFWGLSRVLRPSAPQTAG